MLYIFHGTNIQTGVQKASALLASLRSKKPDASYIKIEAGNWTPSIVEEHLGGQGLFSNKYIIFLDRVTENTEAKEQLIDIISAMQESTNIFVVLEGKLNIELIKAFEKHAEKVIEVKKSENLKNSIFSRWLMRWGREIHSEPGLCIAKLLIGALSRKV